MPFLPSDYFQSSSQYFFIILPTKFSRCGSPVSDQPLPLNEYNYKIRILQLGGLPISLFEKVPLSICQIVLNPPTIIVKTPYTFISDQILHDPQIFQIYGPRICTKPRIHVQHLFKLPTLYSNIFYTSISSFEIFVDSSILNTFPPIQAITLSTTQIINIIQITQNPQPYSLGYIQFTDYEPYATPATTYMIYTQSTPFSITNSEPNIPTILSTPNLTISDLNTNYTLTIYYPDHNLQAYKELYKKIKGHCNPFDESQNKLIVWLNGFIDYYIIPASALNQPHIVQDIIDNNYFTILIPASSYNIIYPPTQTIDFRGGSTSTIGIAIPFRISPPKCDQSNCNQPNDLETFQLHQRGTFTKLITPSPYLTLKIKHLNNMSNTSKPNKIYAKIQIPKTDTYVYNTNLANEFIYDTPIKSLNELVLSFYDSWGTLVDPSALQYSFIINVGTLDDLPFDSNVSPNTGKTLAPLVTTPKIQFV